ncbi:MAG: L-serine ammonia-lyase [Candidatus Melainabacteria bacterium]|nr:L-serine ammonia-lyase [Candidatus Melainabacteria bacterium]
MILLRADHIGPLEMFKIGVGPSSSHTVGPMVAALAFRGRIEPILKRGGNCRLEVELLGSLSATGKGHATDGAVCAGILGYHPRLTPVKDIWDAKELLEAKGGFESCSFIPSSDIIFGGWTLNDPSGSSRLPHPNTMRFCLYENDQIALEEIWISVGGGFVERLGERAETEQKIIDLPYPYDTAQEFIDQVLKSGLSPWDLVIANQKVLGLSEEKLRWELGEIWKTMTNCIEAGLSTEGILPGGLSVRRRAKKLFQELEAGKTPAWSEHDLRPSVYAMAVNEENAAGGRVVTAPTNGSSGLIPAVWRTLKERQNLDDTTLQNGLIVASVVGALVKVHASISGAEVGCQGEVGTSCAMAAGGAVAMLGGNINQIEQAAEIGIEHHLGMTCDPIMGLVQVPCIERNAMGAVKALNAAALSLASDGQHLVSLDKALSVMKQTGLDMNNKYKETSTGGLALG